DPRPAREAEHLTGAERPRRSVVRRLLAPHPLVVGAGCPAVPCGRGIRLLVVRGRRLRGRAGRGRELGAAAVPRAHDALPRRGRLVVHSSMTAMGCVSVSAVGVSGWMPRMPATRAATAAGSLYRSKACTRT